MERQKLLQVTIETKPAKVQALKEVMNGHFDRLKDDTGLTIAQREAEKVDDTSEIVFRQLRPQSNMSFHDYIKYENSLPRNKKHHEALQTSINFNARKIRPPSNKSAMLQHVSGQRSTVKLTRDKSNVEMNGQAQMRQSMDDRRRNFNVSEISIKESQMSF